MNRHAFQSALAGLALLLSASSLPCIGQVTSTYRGRTILIPDSSIPRPGRANTNYFIVQTPGANFAPIAGDETPGSVACVYQLVPGPAGCPISTSTTVPTGGVGAIAIVDAGDYPTAAQDLQAFSDQFGLPAADLQVVYADGTKPPVYSDWLLEEALDIEWAHAMAPNAKIFLVESKISHTDPTFQAVQVAGNMVKQNGGGVISMSWGIPEFPTETQFDKYFQMPGVVYFAASGDFGLNFPFHPAASPNVVAVGGTYFNRDSQGKFLNEQYDSGGGGAISTYEPIPSYQSVISSIVGTHRGFPDVASDYCCADVYLQGSWYSVGGTSWSSPTFAGIVNAAGLLKKSSNAELSMIYKEYANPTQYKADFNDITTGAGSCKVGWDLCAGVGSPRTYKGK
ncbi:MAG: S53 family peptidase [Acidobacteriales bacterium]|nr:S53 family peptidase [Terriglobales bacterium]